MIREKEQDGEQYLSVEIEDDFHEALKRGHPIPGIVSGWGGG